MLSTQELGTVSGTELVVMAVMKQGKGTENGELGVLPQEASEKIQCWSRDWAH